MKLANESIIQWDYSIEFIHSYQLKVYFVKNVQNANVKIRQFDEKIPLPSQEVIIIQTV